MTSCQCLIRMFRANNCYISMAVYYCKLFISVLSCCIFINVLFEFGSGCDLRAISSVSWDFLCFFLVSFVCIRTFFTEHKMRNVIAVRSVLYWLPSREVKSVWQVDGYAFTKYSEDKLERQKVELKCTRLSIYCHHKWTKCFVASV